MTIDEHRSGMFSASGNARTCVCCTTAKANPITITEVDSHVEREPLLRPFGFKGGYMTEIWQSMAFMRGDRGIGKVGLSVQSILWSDAKVFASYSERDGNALMVALTEYALKIARGRSFRTPVDLLDDILDEVYDYGKTLTKTPDLRKTFALNALVGVDNAAWLLYAQTHGLKNFDDMIPCAYRPALSHRHTQVASIPAMAYSVPISEIEEAVAQGYFFMKIKMGQPGTQEDMLAKDKARLSDIHKAIGHVRTPHTRDGKLPYYFDINGRYLEKHTLMKLLDQAEKIDALDQIALIEEPFPEELDIHVGGLGVRIAADESAHTDKDALERIQMGYSAIALKAIAKTLSMTLRIAQVAHEKSVPCFCADLTGNPILVDWNKAVAARLAPFPALGLGLLETNGHQNYKHWETMVGYHPHAGASWTQTVDGVFNLNKEYYERSGGILTPSRHYEACFKHRE